MSRHRWVAEIDFYRRRGMAPDLGGDAVAALERSFLILGPPEVWIERLAKVRELEINPLGTAKGIP